MRDAFTLRELGVGGWVGWGERIYLSGFLYHVLRGKQNNGPMHLSDMSDLMRDRLYFTDAPRSVILDQWAWRPLKATAFYHAAQGGRPSRRRKGAAPSRPTTGAAPAVARSFTSNDS